MFLPLTALILAKQGPSLDRYLHFRRLYHVQQAASVDALATVVGDRVLEVKGLVNGVVKGSGGATLVLKTDEGAPLYVDTDQAPEWLSGGDVHARLLLKVHRANPDDELRSVLLDAAPEFEIAKVEADAAAKAAAARARAEKHRPHASKGPSPEWSLPVYQVEPLYASFIRKQNRHLSKSDADLIARGILAFSVKYGVDARLIMAMIMVESGFDPNSTSRTGAKGLGQLMPDTARWMGVSDAYNSVDNLYGTVKLIRTHLDKYSQKTRDSFEALVLSLAAYNAGEGAVSRHGGVPPYRETQAYIRRVIRLYQELSGR